MEKEQSGILNFATATRVSKAARDICLPAWFVCCQKIIKRVTSGEFLSWVGNKRKSNDERMVQRERIQTACAAQSERTHALRMLRPAKRLRSASRSCREQTLSEIRAVTHFAKYRVMMYVITHTVCYSCVYLCTTTR